MRPRDAPVSSKEDCLIASNLGPATGCALERGP